MISICLDHDIFALCFMSLDVFQCLLAHSLETNRICILQLCKNCINVNYFETSPISQLVKTLSANEGDMRDCGFDSWVGKIPGGGNGNPLQYSCLESLMDRGAWWATSIGSQRVGHD